MALVYLMNKPQVLECIARWLVLFLDMNSLWFITHVKLMLWQMPFLDFSYYKAY
jgi:hypothetical protein